MFRQQLIEIYQTQDLPTTFSVDEGEFSVNDRVDNEAPYYDMVASEYNYSWQMQTVYFLYKKIKIVVEASDLGEHYYFEYTSNEGQRIFLYRSFGRQYLPSPNKAKWLKALHS